MERHVRYIDNVSADSLADGYTNPGWYFWDETESYCHGPYINYQETVGAMSKYAETLECPEPQYIQVPYN
jgi:hypothetical protein